MPRWFGYTARLRVWTLPQLVAVAALIGHDLLRLLFVGYRRLRYVCVDLPVCVTVAVTVTFALLPRSAHTFGYTVVLRCWLVTRVYGRLHARLVVALHTVVDCAFLAWRCFGYFGLRCCLVTPFYVWLVTRYVCVYAFGCALIRYFVVVVVAPLRCYAFAVVTLICCYDVLFPRTLITLRLEPLRARLNVTLLVTFTVLLR